MSEATNVNVVYSARIQIWGWMSVVGKGTPIARFSRCPTRCFRVNDNPQSRVDCLSYNIVSISDSGRRTCGPEPVDGCEQILSLFHIEL